MQHPGNEQVLHVSKPSNTLGGLDFYEPRCAGRNDEPPPIRKYIVLQLLQGGIFSVQLKDHSPGPQTGKDRWLRCLSSSVGLSEYKEPQTSWGSSQYSNLIRSHWYTVSPTFRSPSQPESYWPIPWFRAWCASWPVFRCRATACAWTLGVTARRTCDTWVCLKLVAATSAKWQWNGGTW